MLFSLLVITRAGLWYLGFRRYHHPHCWEDSSNAVLCLTQMVLFSCGGEKNGCQR